MVYLCNAIGGLAQLVRALAWHARGREFESHILHKLRRHQSSFFVVIVICTNDLFFPPFSKEDRWNVNINIRVDTRGRISYPPQTKTTPVVFFLW